MWTSQPTSKENVDERDEKESQSVSQIYEILQMVGVSSRKTGP